MRNPFVSAINATIKVFTVAEKLMNVVENEVDSVTEAQDGRLLKARAKRTAKMQKWQAKQALKES